MGIMIPSPPSAKRPSAHSKPTNDANMKSFVITRTAGKSAGKGAGLATARYVPARNTLFL